ncbi:MAG TPA: helicase [Firmicutes bacterium]|nr:helicase [Bacillota bacterium]
MTYKDFLKQKTTITPAAGITVSKDDINPQLFDFQRDIVRWSLKKGRSAIFAGCGLGKTPMQLEWARHVHDHTHGDVLILAPLAVASQTVQEGRKFGIDVSLCRKQTDIKHGINITNYEMLQHFIPENFAGVVLDESSILKSYSGATRNEIINAFKNTPYRLACTATPAPNDHMELGNHSEFLGVMTRSEMLSMFFVHDGGNTAKWRLKGHAQKKYWEWVASWAVMMQRPSDLGYEDGKFILPELKIEQITLHVGKPNAGELFPVVAETLQERQRARSSTVEERAAKCAEIANRDDEPMIAWCNLNAESEELARQIHGAVEIRGSNTPEQKEERMNDFSDGTITKLVTKPSIAGFGMNWQHCAKMAFVGLSDSFEEYYQAVRRCWRFGQEKPVEVYVITADTEGAVVENIKRKEADFETMLKGMISATQEITKHNINETVRETTEYNPQVEMALPEWLKGEAA